MSHTARMTLLGLYEYDASLFDGFEMPENIDRQQAIRNLLVQVGEKPVLYASHPFMKQAVGIWSVKWKDALNRIQAALQAEYNPLHNFDRNEEYTDDEKTSNKLSSEAGSTTETDGVTERVVSAYNSSEYQPEGREKTDNALETKNKSDSSGSGERNLKHNAHLYGNIGVTTSQQMLIAELDLRKTSNIYDIICGLFEKELLLYIY